MGSKDASKGSAIGAIDRLCMSFLRGGGYPGPFISKESIKTTCISGGQLDVLGVNK